MKNEVKSCPKFFVFCWGFLKWIGSSEKLDKILEEIRVFCSALTVDDLKLIEMDDFDAQAFKEKCSKFTGWERCEIASKFLRDCREELVTKRRQRLFLQRNITGPQLIARFLTLPESYKLYVLQKTVSVSNKRTEGRGNRIVFEVPEKTGPNGIVEAFVTIVAAGPSESTAEDATELFITIDTALSECEKVCLP